MGKEHISEKISQVITLPLSYAQALKPPSQLQPPSPILSLSMRPSHTPPPPVPSPSLLQT